MSAALRARWTRRSALIGVGSIAVATSALVPGCGGGGSSGGEDGGGASGSTLGGSVWYKRDNQLLSVPSGGTGMPTQVGAIRPADGVVNSYFPRISRKSTRYLQLGHHGAGTSVGTTIWIYDHATHQPYGYVDMEGFATFAFMSPSGRYIGMRRAPELLNDYFGATETSIAGLTIVDVTDINNAVGVRGTMPSGNDAVMQFAWLDGDRFVYITKGRSIYTGSAADGGSADRLLGQLDQQGMTSGKFDMHPDGQSMLVELGITDTSSDIYLYAIDGRSVARLTRMQQANSPQYSPDGTQFMFSYGNSPGCIVCGGSTCTVFHAPTSARDLTYADGQQYDALKVSCTTENYWSAVG